MSAFRVDERRVKDLAAILGNLRYTPDNFQEVTPFVNDPYREAHFIFFLTAIDHNTHGKKRYETSIRGQLIHGSDLLYWKAKEAAKRDPDLFTPDRMSKITEREIVNIFTTQEGLTPSGVFERVLLFQDTGDVLNVKYGSDVQNLFKQAGGYLRPDFGTGILKLLRDFKAYEDPLEKKSFLLIKILRRRNLVDIKDVQNIAVPVDHMLITIALRSGLIAADELSMKTILGKQRLTEEATERLRDATLRAFCDVSNYSGIASDYFDDLLWAYGRECFRYPAPFSEDKIDKIKIGLNTSIGNKEALTDFFKFINGLDANSPPNTKMYPIPVFPDTLYF